MKGNVNQQLLFRTEVLSSFGADTAVTKEILSYTENKFDRSRVNMLQYPLPDEIFVDTWKQYAEEAERAGSIKTLSKYLVQLRFPILQGISENHDYIAATHRGADTSGMSLASGAPLREPQRFQIVLHHTPTGRIPVLTVESREDFVTLVQALSCRNEPEAVPDSMGSCMVAGYNNWHRISVLRDRFHKSATQKGSWLAEFQRIKAQKELYQDRFIILATGPYSGVNALDIGLHQQDWLSLSHVIRREHECTHYFTRRVLSSMHNNLLDEIIADYSGITAAMGRFKADWLLRFFGLESFPCYREGGRLQNYRGTPPLSDPAFEVLQRMVVATAANLEQFDHDHVPEFHHSRMQPALLLMLTSLTIEEMASRNAQRIMDARFAN